MTDPCLLCNDEGEYKTRNGQWQICPLCCPHDEKDHGICLSCGADAFQDDVAAAEFAADCAEDR